MTQDIQHVRRAKAHLVSQLRRTCPRAAVGLTLEDGRYVLCVDLPDEDGRSCVPASVDGYGVRVRVVGHVSAAEHDHVHRGRDTRQGGRR